MINQYGPALIFLGTIGFFYGIVNFFIVTRHRYKYKNIIATISASRKYTLKLRGDTTVCHAVVLDFAVNQKGYKVRKDISKEKWAYSESSNPYKIGQQIQIYYNSRNPEDIDLDLRKFYRKSCVLCPAFFFAGLVLLVAGIYLTAYYN